ncbi:MAG: ABC transporter permease [Armatimonadota bacterium]|nr:MAG: ABC transporter permease [Armatimonadota bacterium]
MPEWLETWRSPIAQDALRVGIILATVGGYLGVYVVLKRIVFVGAALAQVSAAGVALAFLVGWNPLLSATLFALAGSAFFAQPWGERRTSREALIGAVFLTFSALTVLLASKGAHGMEEVQHLLAGDILAVAPEEVVRIWALGIVVLAAFVLLRKEFLLVAFDAETAQALGYRTRLWEFAFYLMLGGFIGVVIHLVGLVLIFGYLVLPALGGLMLARRMTQVVGIAIVNALIATIAGLLVSILFDLPTTATMLVFMSALAGVESAAGALLSR